MSIGIDSRKIWAVSRRRLVKALAEYYSNVNPTILFTNKYHIMSDKIMMNIKLDELGILHPKTYYYPFDDMPYNRRKCVIKYRFGSKGNHLVFTTFNKADIFPLEDMYIQDYIPFEKEYRVGVDWLRVLGVREKIGNCKVRNSKSCDYITRKDLPEIEDLAFTVARAFNVDFTGMDIGLYRNDYYIIELNSCATIGKVWANKLKNDLKKRLYEVLDNV